MPHGTHNRLDLISINCPPIKIRELGKQNPPLRELQSAQVPTCGQGIGVTARHFNVGA